MSLDVKPELDSGFLICGAPVMVALLWTGELLDRAAAAEGNVGLTGAEEEPALKLAVGGADIVAEEDCAEGNRGFEGPLCVLIGLDPGMDTGGPFCI